MSTAIETKVLAGERIGPEEALELLTHRSLAELGALADLVRRRMHTDGVVTYIIDRNVNYTNVCNAFCSFCAFYRPPGHDEGYVLPIEVIENKIAETYALDPAMPWALSANSAGFVAANSASSYAITPFWYQFIRD